MSGRLGHALIKAGVWSFLLVCCVAFFMALSDPFLSVAALVDAFLGPCVGVGLLLVGGVLLVVAGD